MTARDIARDVLLEAVGSSATPFVPVPFVDGWIFARLLRRIAKKVLVRHGLAPSKDMTKEIADGFVGAGEKPFVERAAVGAVRFVVRKVAVVLDVKRSHDVFGEVIAFALALDTAIARGAIASRPPRDVGALLHRAVSTVESAALEALARAVRGDALGAQIDDAHARLASAVDAELGAPR